MLPDIQGEPDIQEGEKAVVEETPVIEEETPISKDKKDSTPPENQCVSEIDMNNEKITMEESNVIEEPLKLQEDIALPQSQGTPDIDKKFVNILVEEANVAEGEDHKEAQEITDSLPELVEVNIEELQEAIKEEPKTNKQKKQVKFDEESLKQPDDSDSLKKEDSTTSQLEIDNSKLEQGTTSPDMTRKKKVKKVKKPKEKQSTEIEKDILKTDTDTFTMTATKETDTVNQQLDIKPDVNISISNDEIKDISKDELKDISKDESKEELKDLAKPPETLETIIPETQESEHNSKSIHLSKADEIKVKQNYNITPNACSIDTFMFCNQNRFFNLVQKITKCELQKKLYLDFIVTVLGVFALFH